MTRLVGFTALLATGWLALAADAAVTLKVECTPAEGWGAGGWGGARITLRNDGDAPARYVALATKWYIGEEEAGDVWNEKPDQEIPPGGEYVHGPVGVLPVELAERAAPGHARIAGTVTVRVGDREEQLPLSLDVPTARLPEPLRQVTSGQMALELMESRISQWPNHQRVLRWLDQSYQAMAELTGGVPFDGRVLVIKEAPAHPWWAYAGNPIIMSTRYVPDVMEEVDANIIPFGWVHEIGHCFDVHGPWYIWNGPSCEFQANFKLAYAVETIADPALRVNRARFKGGAYPVRADEAPMTGRDFVDAFFTTFGDDYLGDPTRTWDTLSSDEMHALFQRIVRAYGWDTFKGMYRTYARLAAQEGLEPPASEEDKVRLLVAVLSHHARVDLVPIFARWRFPVTAENVAAVAAKYPLSEAAAPARAREQE